MNVIGTVFSEKGAVGDFDWMIRSGQYEDAIFLFEEDEIRQNGFHSGKGNAVIRKYNSIALNRPRSVGIVVGNHQGAYTELTAEVRDKIDACFHNVRYYCQIHGYTTVYYLVKTSDGPFDVSTDQLNPDVLAYITQSIRNLGRVPDVPPITEEAKRAIQERLEAVNHVKEEEKSMATAYDTESSS
jgi:hypothetical protein